MKVTNLFTGKRPVPSIVPDLDRQLADAQLALDTLEAKRGDLALDVALGKPDAAAAMAAFNVQVTAAREAFTNANAALATAKQREAAELAESKAVIRRLQISNIGKLLRDYLNAVEKYQTAAMECELQFRAAITAGDEAARVAGLSGWTWPLWAAPGNYKRLMAAIETELWRIGSGPEGSIADRQFPMPGAKHHLELVAERPDTKFASRPMDFIPLMERQRFEIERIKQLLRGDAEAPIEAPTMPAKPVVETGPAADDLADLEANFNPQRTPLTRGSSAIANWSLLSGDRASRSTPQPLTVCSPSLA